MELIDTNTGETLKKSFDKVNANTNELLEALQVESDSAGAGETRLLVYDVDTAIWQRVKAGADGTGPGGVGRALYFDNIV